MYTRARFVEGIGDWDGSAIAGVPREAALLNKQVEVFSDTFDYQPFQSKFGPIPLMIVARHSFEGDVMAEAGALSQVGEGKHWPSYPAIVEEIRTRALPPKPGEKPGDLFGHLKLTGVPTIAYVLS